MKIGLLLALLAAPAFAQDAGISDGGFGDTAAVHQAVIDEQLADGGVGRRLLVVGGCWLSESYCVGYAGELADSRAQNGYFRQHVGDAPYLWMLGASGAGVLLGGGAVWGWEKLHP